MDDLTYLNTSKERVASLTELLSELLKRAREVGELVEDISASTKPGALSIDEQTYQARLQKILQDIQQIKP